jgi:hypothetical protein
MGTFYAGARRKFGARRLAAAAVYNIPGSATGLPENAGASDPDLPNRGGRRSTTPARR